MDVIKDCLITQSDAKILKKYCVDKSDPLYKQYKGYNTSINLETTKVYSMCYGLVVHVSGDAKYGYEVGVRVNQNQAIKYGNLKSINVKMHNVVDVSQQLGEANRYVSIEYLTTNIKNSYPYRIGSVQMYKDDPMKILDEDTSELKSTSPQYSQSGLQSVIDEFDGGDPYYVSPEDEYQQY